MTRPKLSISTLGCPNWDFIKTLQEFNKLGIDAMEVRGVDGQMDADKILRFKPENQAETKRLLKQYNVKMIGFGSSASFHNPDNVEQMIESTKREIDICSQMDIPAIRVFGNDIPDPKKQDQTVKQVTNALGQVAHYAAQKGMLVNLEIHGGFNTRETVQPIVQELKGEPGFGIIWDINHSDKTYKDNFKPFYDIIKPRLKHTHIKDYIRSDSGKWTLTLIGEGDIPIKPIMQLLKNEGYDGYYSFEWEKKWHPYLPEPEVAFPHFIKTFNKWWDELD